MTWTTVSVKFHSRKHLTFHQNSTLKMTTFAEEVTQHLELFIKHLTDNNEVIDEYNEEFLVDATIISLKTRGTIQSHLEETNTRLVFYTYIREYKQQQFHKFMQDQQPPSSTSNLPVHEDMRGITLQL
jgi:hypothetical protein